MTTIPKRNHCRPSIFQGLELLLFPNNHGSGQWPFLESQVIVQHHGKSQLQGFYTWAVTKTLVICFRGWNPTHLYKGIAISQRIPSWTNQYKWNVIRFLIVAIQPNLPLLCNPARNEALLSLAHLRWSPYSRTAPLSWSWDLTNVGPTKSLTFI